MNRRNFLSLSSVLVHATRCEGPTLLAGESLKVRERSADTPRPCENLIPRPSQLNLAAHSSVAPVRVMISVAKLDPEQRARISELTGIVLRQWIEPTRGPVLKLEIAFASRPAILREKKLARAIESEVYDLRIGDTASLTASKYPGLLRGIQTPHLM